MPKTERRVRICILRHGGYPYCSRVAKEVKTLLDAGAQVDLICLSDGTQPFFEQQERLTIYRLPLQRHRGGLLRYAVEYGVSFALMGGLLSALFLRRRHARVQVNTLPDFLVFTTVLPKLAGAEVAIDMHEPTPELWRTKFSRRRLHTVEKLLVWIEQLAIRYADQVLTVTEPLRRRFGERGADTRKIVVIPNSCDESKFFPDPGSEAVRRQPGRFVAVTHGTIEERYGHELMVRAIHLLKDRLPQLQLVIGGGGSFRPTLEKLVRRLNCEDRIAFIGYLPLDELRKLLGASHVGINAMYRSPYSELIDTNKMYEYIAMRLPVVTSRLPPIEANFDDESLMYFEAGNADDLARCLLTLHDQPQRREAMVQSAMRQYAALRWSTTRARYAAQLLRPAAKNQRSQALASEAAPLEAEPLDGSAGWLCPNRRGAP
jgi:glycosyltransferase involved in cell wall biosynthesis